MDSRKLFQRLWSEEDEIVLFNGLRDYRAQKEFEPPKNMIDFHEFIKTSIHVDVSTSQLRDKVRKLKTKYKTSKGDPNFTKPHDQKMFQLAKKVWGSETESPLKEEPAPSESLNNELLYFNKNLGVVGQLGNILKRGRELIEGSKEAELQKQWKKLDYDELELLARMKELNCAALELFVERMELVKYEARQKMEAYKSSSK